MTLLQTHYSVIIASHSNILATKAALMAAKGWAQKRCGNRLHKDSFQTLASLTHPHRSPSQADNTHAPEPQPDQGANTVDSGPRQLVNDELDIRDEREFPRLNRDMPPPPGSLYLVNRPTFIEQYPHIRPKQSKTKSTAPNPEPAVASTTNRPPRWTGPVKDSVIVTHQAKMQTPTTSPIGAGALTLTEMRRTTCFKCCMQHYKHTSEFSSLLLLRSIEK